MSFTGIMGVPAEGPIRMIGEVHNSHQGAAVVWSCLSERYLSRKYSIIGPHDDLWKLGDDEGVWPEHRVVLQTTFDGVMVAKDDLPDVILCIEDFVAEFRPPYCNLLKQVQVFDAHRDSDDYVAFAWWQNSVCSDMWDVHEPDGIDDDSRWRDFDLSRDADVPLCIGTKAWFLDVKGILGVGWRERRFREGTKHAASDKEL